MTTIRIKHTKVSGKPPPGDSSLVGGNNWDENHSFADAAEVKSDLGLVAIASSGSAADLTTGIIPDARMPNLTGDVTTSEGAVATTLATVNADVGSFTNADITVNAKGLITAAANGSGGGGGGMAGKGQFGSGIDGTVDFDGTDKAGWTRSSLVYTAQRPDYAYADVTFSAGVVLEMSQGGTVASGEFWSHKVTLPASGTVTIRLNGLPGSGATGAAALGTGHTGAVAGAGATANQNAGVNAANHSGSWPSRYRAGLGGVGGASLTNAGSTVAAGATTVQAESIGAPIKWDPQISQGRLGLNNAGIFSGGGGGGSGGGTTGIGAGGGGGGGAGVLTVGIRETVSSGSATLVIEANGGAGGNAPAAGGSNAGGGSGGGGGYSHASCGEGTLPASWSVTANGGAGGSPQGAGTAGSAGNAGKATTFTMGS